MINQQIVCRIFRFIDQNTYLIKQNQIFLTKQDEIWRGELSELLCDSDSKSVIKCIKNFSRKELYRSYEAESIELSGYSIIGGLLKHFGKLLKLDKETFGFLMSNNINEINGKNVDLEWRLACLYQAKTTVKVNEKVQQRSTPSILI